VRGATCEPPSGAARLTSRASPDAGVRRSLHWPLQPRTSHS
jgi:hypothetical protein